jgi:hypothetical protein
LPNQKEINMDKPIIATLALTIFGIGYWIAPKELLDEEVKHTGFLQVDTTKILSATVESLRAKNSLVVWSYKGTVRVRAHRERYWLLNGTQELIVPAVVDYRLELSDLSPAYDDEAKLVTVRLPKLVLSDVAFQPEEATTINGGSLSFSDDTVQELSKLSYRTARKGMVKQAQQAAMVAVAKGRAIENIEQLFEIPLRAAGLQDVRVVAKFD